MRDLDDIERVFRSHGELHTRGEDGMAGYLPGFPSGVLCVVVSNGGGWDHVSVSVAGRCPSWREMCLVKRNLFEPEEVVMQLHPAERDHINCHPFCLHLWRPQKGAIPTPPTWMVGPLARTGELR